MIYSVSQFQRVQSMVAWPHALGQTMATGVCGRGKLFISRWAKTRERVHRRNQGKILPHKEKPPVTYFLQLDPSPAFYPLPIMSSNYKSMENEIIHYIRALMI
jgi:hypothetical protein